MTIYVIPLRVGAMQARLLVNAPPGPRGERMVASAAQRIAEEAGSAQSIPRLRERAAAIAREHELTPIAH